MDNFNKAYNAYIEAYNGVNVKENEKIVLECKTIWSYCFAKHIHEADIKAHEQVILEIKDPQSSFHFAKYISEENVEEHFKVILNSGSKVWLDCFIKEVNYKGTKVEDWLLYI